MSIFGTRNWSAAHKEHCEHFQSLNRGALEAVVQNHVGPIINIREMTDEALLRLVGVERPPLAKSDEAA